MKKHLQKIFFASIILMNAMSIDAQTIVASGEMGNVSWQLTSDSLMTISGSGIIPNYSLSGSPWYAHRRKINEVIIANGITQIGNNAFSDAIKIHSVSIPNSVTRIGYGAFYGASLQTVNIPNSVTYLSGFNACPLTSINIPNSVDTIGTYAFAGCTSLTSVSIPNSVTTIEDHAFSATGLRTITIHDSVQYIGDDAFRNCTNLTTLNYNAVNCRFGVSSSLGSTNRVFYGCNAFTILNIGNNVQSIPFGAFAKTKLTAVIFPNSVTTIKESAFQDCPNLISVTFSNSITSIQQLAFYKTGLTSVSIPNSVTTIEYGIFAECPNLTSVNIPNSVSTIEGLVFRRCTSLQQIKVNWQTPLTNIQSNMFMEVTTSNVTLIVPRGKEALYKAANIWKDFRIIGDAEPSVIPANDNTVIRWYAISGITGYALTVFTDAAQTQVFGAYTLDASGQPQSAPAQYSTIRSIADASLTYTVMGLSAETSYWYNLKALNGSNTIATFESEFVTTNNATSIVSINDAVALYIYPNPVKDVLFIMNNEQLIMNNNETLQIVDLSGKTLMSLPSQSSQINVSHLPAGVYFVKIGEFVGKFIKE